MGPMDPVDLQRSSHRGNSVHGADQAHVGRTLSQRHRAADDQDGAREDSGGAHAGHGSSQDQAQRVRGDSTDEGAELEDEQGGEIGPLHRVEGVQFPKDQLQGAGRQQIRGSVPADILQRVKLVGNARNGRRNDGVILSRSGQSLSLDRGGIDHTRAIQNTDRHSAMVIRANRHLAGYSISSSSFSSCTLASTPVSLSSGAGSATGTRVSGSFDSAGICLFSMLAESTEDASVEASKLPIDGLRSHRVRSCWW
jgi:hypothetical protein